MNFKTQILTLAHSGKGHIIKTGAALNNPTMSELDKAMRALGANVQGSLSQALAQTSLLKPKTTVDYKKIGNMVFLYCLVYYSE